MFGGRLLFVLAIYNDSNLAMQGAIFSDAHTPHVHLQCFLKRRGLDLSEPLCENHRA